MIHTNRFDEYGQRLPDHDHLLAHNAHAAPPRWDEFVVPRHEPLYPTVTLHSPASRVLCSFSAADVAHRTRAAIGAPRGCLVYALDGSILLQAESDHVEASS